MKANRRDCPSFYLSSAFTYTAADTYPSLSLPRRPAQIARPCAKSVTTPLLARSKKKTNFKSAPGALLGPSWAPKSALEEPPAPLWPPQDRPKSLQKREESSRGRNSRNLTFSKVSAPPRPLGNPPSAPLAPPTARQRALQPPLLTSPASNSTHHRHHLRNPPKRRPQERPHVGGTPGHLSHPRASLFAAAALLAPKTAPRAPPDRPRAPFWSHNRPLRSRLALSQSHFESHFSCNARVRHDVLTTFPFFFFPRM